MCKNKLYENKTKPELLNLLKKNYFNKYTEGRTKSPLSPPAYQIRSKVHYGDMEMLTWPIKTKCRRSHIIATFTFWNILTQQAYFLSRLQTSRLNKLRTPRIKNVNFRVFVWTRTDREFCKSALVYLEDNNHTSIYENFY